MTIFNIDEVNFTMRKDLSSHKFNQKWITENKPLSISGNKYNYLRADAPFYCISSMGVMLNFYEKDESFQNRIIDYINQISQDKYIQSANLTEITDWVVRQTLFFILEEGSDKLDLQNVGWWMGMASYVACIISTNHKAQYEMIFLGAWNQYFTNENLD